MTAVDQPTDARYAVVIDVYDVLAYTQYLADQGDHEGAEKVWEEGGGEDRVSVHDTEPEAEQEAWQPAPIPGVRFRVEPIEAGA